MRYLVSILFLSQALLLSSQSIEKSRISIRADQREYNLDLERKLNQGNSNNYRHSLSKPYVLSDESDSLGRFDEGRWTRKQHKKWPGRKLRNENFVVIDTSNFYLTIDPLVNFQFGKDQADSSGKDITTNTRGFLVQGAIGNKFAFQSSFYENQSFFQDYLAAYVSATDVVPGQGRTKPFKSTGFDYAMASGVMAFRPSKYFSIQLGQGKNFIGHGYRSLLLSDNTFNYPYLKLTGSFFKNKLQYQTMHASLIELNRLPATTSSEAQFIRKAGTFHTLGFMPIPQLEISLFEGVIYQNWDSVGTQPLPATFFIPVMFLNTAVGGMEGSAVKPVLGLNVRANPVKNLKIYGQLANDQYNGKSNMAYQGGVQLFDLFGIKDLHIQGEYNHIDRDMFSQKNPDLNYVHYNGFLGHPSGNDLDELIAFLNYRFRDFFLNLKVGNIRQNYWYTDVNNNVSQAIRVEKTTTYPDISFGYMFNPKTNMMFKMGYSGRNLSNPFGTEQTELFYISLRMDLQNVYYDF